MRMTIVAAALALAACGQGQQPAPQKTADGTANVPGWISERDSILPDWLQLARTTDKGFVHYNAKTISRNAGADTADVWVQVLHGDPQLSAREDGDVIHEVRFFKERYLYRFRCGQERFAIIERHVMGEGETVLQRFETPPQSEDDWRDIKQGGPAFLVFGPACTAS